jgi:hypothetical protein
MFKLVRQRDFVARFRSTQKKMEVEPSRYARTKQLYAIMRE